MSTTGLREHAWKPVGETSNTRYYAVQHRVLAGVPRQGCSDDALTAAENTRFQIEYFRSFGQAGLVVVFFDTMVSQDSGARRVYQTMPDPRYMFATALVGGTLLSRAMGSFFLGLSKPAIPVKMFSHLRDAIQWGQGLMSQHDHQVSP